MSGTGPGGDVAEEGELVGLMIAYQAGQREAFERLYARLVADLRPFLLGAVRDGALLEDLVQETFLEIHRSRRLYLPPLPVRPWAFGIARNVLRRHRRTAWRRARREGEWTPRLEEDRPAPGGTGGRGLDVRDVEAALRSLPAGRRDAWLLHHVHGFSFQQVADRLRIGVGAAKLKSSRAMRTLRLALGIAREPRDE